jgi:hypothetical protein
MSEHQVERPRHTSEIKCLDEQPRVADFPPGAAAHEAPELVLGPPSLPRRLLLERAEGSKLSLSVDDLLDGRGTKRADQLVLQVCDADEEAELFHLAAGQVGAEACSLETASEVALLCGVAQARQPEVEPLRPEHTEGFTYGLRTADRHDGNALSVEVPASALGECFECDLVADPFDEDDRTRVDAASHQAQILPVPAGSSDKDAPDSYRQLIIRLRDDGDEHNTTRA